MDQAEMTPAHFDAQEVERLLDYPGCIAAMRSAMTSLSEGDEQPLRQVVDLGAGRLFGLMPGSLLAEKVFGGKLVSVFENPCHPGQARHQGLIVVFDALSGLVSATADAEAVTTIRTACASAAATEALARSDAAVLAIFGTGRQARAHLRALTLVREFKDILLWGRDPLHTKRQARAISAEFGREIAAISNPAEAARRADVICTVTSSPTPILLGAWVGPGTHINLVGSSQLGPVEVDTELVLKARFFADYRPSVLAQGSEIAIGRDAGLLTDDHVVGEIGQVFGGMLEGREDDQQITVYKSLGHVVQDLAAVRHIHERTAAHASSPPTASERST